MKTPAILRAEFHDRERYARFLGAGLQLVYQDLLNKVGEYGDHEAKQALKIIDDLLMVGRAEDSVKQQRDITKILIKPPSIDSEHIRQIKEDVMRKAREAEDAIRRGSVAIQIGDVVRLKSGGPKMTASVMNEHREKKIWTCQWFVGNDLKEALFFEAELEKVA